MRFISFSRSLIGHQTPHNESFFRLTNEQHSQFAFKVKYQNFKIILIHIKSKTSVKPT